MIAQKSKLWTLVALAIGSCGTPTTPAPADATVDVAMDASPSCTGNEECNDGLFCNGVEACVEGRCAAGTVVACADDVACTSDSCDETLDRCSFVAPDVDGDGARDATCLASDGERLGTDCNDNDAHRFPGNAEVCDAEGHDEDCNLATNGGLDRDGDAYIDARCCNPTAEGGSSCGEDCDDGRANVNPAATEACDLVDNNCNGTVDEGVLSLGFSDNDRDGFGDHAHSMSACAGTSGFVPTGGASDCDDDDASINPGQVEICDGIDNNCNGVSDPTDVAQSVTWYRDLDGDGFGSEGSGTLEACAPPASGYSLLNTDCNDAVAGINPSSAELCNGIDDDCNGEANFQIANGNLEDDDGDRVADIGCGLPRGLDCDDQDPFTAGGNVETCDGRDNDCDQNVDENAMDSQWFFDADGDGHGSASHTDHPVLRACMPATGYVSSGADCNDNNPMRSPDASESCNAQDDNCNGAVDEGNVCGCSAGTADCNMDNVCETQTAANVSNCGACGNVCSAPPHAGGAICNSGTCDFLRCNLGYEDCDSARPGCETHIQEDESSCGACGNPCAAPAGTHVQAMSCQGFVCRIGSCEAGYADCDGRLDNGCEVNLSNSDQHCGACYARCEPQGGRQPICMNAACYFAPQPDYGDCDGNSANGAESFLGSQQHCGACNVGCVPRTGTDAFCQRSGASYACTQTCQSNYSDCDGDFANGCERPVSASACGCGTAASPIVDCNTTTPGGRFDCLGSTSGQTQCVFLGCNAPAQMCNTQCVNTMNDPNHCGGCHRSCGSGGTCSAGVCTCGPGTTLCNGSCINMQFDFQNCGTCGNSCLSGQTCTNGACQTSCGFGTADCDANPTTCETNTNTDLNNCGGCGVLCPRPTALNVSAGSMCIGGTCNLHCQTDFADCDFNPVNGCETNLRSPQSCGSCMRTCGVGGTCAGITPTCDNPIDVAMGNEHTLVLRSGGRVLAMGANSSGQLGDNSNDARTSPVVVTALAPYFVHAIAAGDAHSCAITQLGGTRTVHCWGQGLQGQLGNGVGNTNFPVQVVGLPTNFVPQQLALGAVHTCVAGPVGTVTGWSVYCFGGNGFGQLGRGSVGTNSATPDFVRDMGSMPILVSQIASGSDFVCGLAADGASNPHVFCWGKGNQGQLGDGTTNTRGYARDFFVYDLYGFQPHKLTVGSDHACVFGQPSSTMSAPVQCWGSNEYGAFAPSVQMYATTPTPVPVPGTSNFTRLAQAGSRSLCVIGDSNQLWCRGYNNFFTNSPTPGTTLTGFTPIPELGALDTFFSGHSTHHGSISAGRLAMWGDNTAGRLGLGTTGLYTPLSLVNAVNTSP